MATQKPKDKGNTPEPENNDEALKREQREDDALEDDVKAKALAAIRSSDYRKGPRPKRSKARVSLKAPKQKWAWFAPLEEWSIGLRLLQRQEEGQFGKDYFLLSPEVAALFDEDDLKEKELVCYVSKAGKVGFWILRPQDEDLDSWNASAWDTIGERVGGRTWTKTKSGDGEYVFKFHKIREGINPEEFLPGDPLEVVVARAFEQNGKFIDDPHHPIIRDELGED